MPKLKDLPKVDRPREKLLRYGSVKLSTTELLAIILRTGTKSMNVVDLASHILKTNGSNNIQNLTLDTLTKIKGLGKVKALEILATIELGKRLLREREPLQAYSPRHVYESLRDMSGHKKEHFLAVYLDTKNIEITREVITIGILNASLVHPREVYEPAVRFLANSIVVVHNHPSGDSTPSQEDIILTRQLKESGDILGIHLLDHIIITKYGYLSFKEQKLL